MKNKNKKSKQWVCVCEKVKSGKLPIYEEDNVCDVTEVVIVCLRWFFVLTAMLQKMKKEEEEKVRVGRRRRDLRKECE